MVLSRELEAQILDDLLKHESFIPWPYCDDKGNVTIGIGHLLPSSGLMLGLLMYHEPTCRSAELHEKQAAWAEVKAAYRKGKGALAYKSLTTVRITSQQAQDMCRARLRREFLPAISRVFPEIDTWPEEAARVTFDIAYTCGAHCFDSGWRNYVACCLAKNWIGAKGECLREDARRPPTDADPEGLGPRNLWAQRLLQRASGKPELL